MRVLFIGDVVGKPGREGLSATMPALREAHKPELVIVNAENAAGGVGITEETAKEIFAAGADAITLGNHAYRHREVYPYLEAEDIAEALSYAAWRVAEVEVPLRQP